QTRNTAVRVSVKLREGSYRNELSRYRYDVVIKKEGEADLAAGSSIVEDSGHGYNIPFLNLLNKEEIIEELEKELPDYMVPDILMPMDHFPLTINGKLDKRSLPNPDFSSTSAYVAPVTETEKILCNIWQTLLTIARVGVTDDFFRIGGNSILAVQASHRMSKATGWEIGVADIFIFQSIQAIIEHKLSAKPEDGVEWSF
ncbi:phosphopantetheine binding protein, partial [Mucilaginibacter oryzae]